MQTNKERQNYLQKQQIVILYIQVIKRKNNDYNSIINKALETITTLNGVKLLNLFAGIDFNSEVIFGKKKEKNAILKTLLSDFNMKGRKTWKKISLNRMEKKYIFMCKEKM